MVMLVGWGIMAGIMARLILGLESRAQLLAARSFGGM
jgi:hypothetical protein